MTAQYIYSEDDLYRRYIPASIWQYRIQLSYALKKYAGLSPQGYFVSIPFLLVIVCTNEANVFRI